MLDTPAKRTLWFHLMPILDEDDQEYCKRKLCIPLFDPYKNKIQPQKKSNLNGLSAVDRDAIKKYYYKHDNKEKYGYDEDFVLTDCEIDNLFDMTSHLPENNRNYKNEILFKLYFLFLLNLDISSSRLNSPNQWVNYWNIIIS